SPTGRGAARPGRRAERPSRAAGGTGSPGGGVADLPQTGMASPQMAFQALVERDPGGGAAAAGAAEADGDDAVAHVDEVDDAAVGPGEVAHLSGEYLACHVVEQRVVGVVGGGDRDPSGGS